MNVRPRLLALGLCCLAAGAFGQGAATAADGPESEPSPEEPGPDPAPAPEPPPPLPPEPAPPVPLPDPDETLAPESLPADDGETGEIPMRYPSRLGEAGVWRVAMARVNRPMTFGFALHGEYMDAPEFPGCMNLPPDECPFERTSYFAGTLAVSFTPVQYFEIFAGMTSSATRSIVSDPELVQTLGDVHFGLKGVYPVSPIFHLGVDVVARFLNPLGGLGLAFGATSGTARALATIDLTEMEMAGGGVAGHKGAPFRAHFNLGFSLDRSENLLRNDNGDTINIGAVERFALGLSKYNAVNIGVAIEAPLKAYYFTPFVEWTLAIPLFPSQAAADRGDFTCLTTGYENCPVNTDLNGDGVFNENTAEVATRGFGSFPDILTLGVRISPPIRGLTIDLSADIGLTTALVWGLAANRQYSANFGLTYTYDPVPRVKTELKEIEKVVTVPAPAPPPPKPPEEAKVVGLVKDAKSGAPIANAIVSFPGKKYTALATDAGGNFESWAFPYGALVIDIARDGYEPSTETIKVDPGGASLSVELVPIIRKSKVTGSVRDADKGTPVGATLAFRNASGATATIVASGGSIEGEIDEGAWAIDITAPGYLAKATTLAVKAGEGASMDIELRKAPLKPLAVLTKDRIVIKKQVNFATGKAEILPKSFGLLDEVASIIISHPEIKKVRVEGHTDNRGADDFNMTLSDDRAKSVMKYLVGAGVDPVRLDAKGFGETKPLAPNTTEKNRAKNRRVELHVEY